MGRGFSTFYRLTLMAMSLAALALSALSAASCSFLKFDHQYDGNGGGGRHLAVQQSSMKTAVDGDATPRKLPQSSAIPGENGEISPSAAVTTTTVVPTIVFYPSPSNSTTASAPSPTAVSPSTASHHASSKPSHKSSGQGGSANTTTSGGQGATTSTSSSSSNVGKLDETSAAAVQVTGEAGLFCDGEASFLVSNLWGGGIKKFEDEIANESNSDQSEELAKNAVVAALAIGSFCCLIILVECILGLRVWCDKLLVGLLAFMACVSQGVTFLFFDSDRYW